MYIYYHRYAFDTHKLTPVSSKLLGEYLHYNNYTIYNKLLLSSKEHYHAEEVYFRPKDQETKSESLPPKPYLN